MASFFGFGSLVNIETHRYDPVSLATVKGWQRIWANDKCYDYAFLSVEPKRGQTIQGLMAQVPNDDWAELDAREVGYTRRVLTEEEWQPVPVVSDALLNQQQIDDAQMYVLENGEFAKPDKPILWSYLETVLVGYYQWFGEKGVEDFVASTGAWTDILDDRSAPIYPRYVAASGGEAMLIEGTIQALIARK